MDSTPRSISVCRAPRCTHVVPHLVQNERRGGPMTITIRADSHAGHLGMSTPPILTGRVRSRSLRYETREGALPFPRRAAAEPAGRQPR